MLYTRKGDNGTSGLFGTTKRFSKSGSVYDALGTLDELNSLLGICKAHAHDVTGEPSLRKELQGAQEALFIIQAELAGAGKRIDTKRVEALEETIDRIEARIGSPRSFVVPGATVASAFLDYGRTVARRAERSVSKAGTTRTLSGESLAYLNRLSSLLYALARYAAAHAGVRETAPSYS